MKDSHQKDNYQIEKERARTLFLKADADALIRKFHLVQDSAYIILRFLDQWLRIDRTSGRIERKGANETDSEYMEDESVYTAMSVFDYLCDSRDDRRLSGRWISTQKLGIIGLMKDGMFTGKAQWFDTRTESLRSACERLGGIEKKPGDVSYVLNVFDELPIWIQFWRGDEEFSPKISLLWDENTLQYVHFETLYYIAPMVLARIKEIMTENV